MSIQVDRGHSRSNEYQWTGYPEVLKNPIGSDKNIQRPVAKNEFQLIPKKIRKSSPKVKSPEAKSGQTKVLLITAHRSGSSFLGSISKHFCHTVCLIRYSYDRELESEQFEICEGELFNQNQNAFYLFEPLAAIQSEMSTMGCDKMIEQKIKYVTYCISDSVS